MTENIKRIAVVTGATSGIGEATARKFIAEGIAVIGNGRNAVKLKSLTEELGELFIGVEGDASDENTIHKLLQTSTEKFNKPVNIVVVNAGLGLGGSVRDADLKKFEEVLKINVSGSLALMQKSANIMVDMQKKNYPGSAADIVVVGSVVGRHISPFSAVYGASKFALHSLAEGLRREIGPKGVRVSLVEPGVVVSGFQEAAGYADETVKGFQEKFGPLLYGNDVAETIYFIVSRPPHVHVGDVVIRSTRQDYP